MSLVPQNLRPIFLRPGQLFVSSDPCWVTTLLGSCVAVTMFHPRPRLAAICHALLAEPGRNVSAAQEGSEPYRYVSLAIPAMAKAFQCRGIAPATIEVKLFGGANLIGTSPGPRPGSAIGRVNVERARQLLEQTSLLLSWVHVGGVTGRKIHFNTLTGEILLHHLEARLSSFQPQGTPCPARKSRS